MAALSLSALVALARSVGFPDPELAAAVAMAESGGEPSAVGDLDTGGSVGLWQIHLASHPEYSTAALVDPMTNARAAWAISSGGRDWSPWTTYRNGTYRAYYSGVTALGAAVAFVVGVGLAMAVDRFARRRRR